MTDLSEGHLFRLYFGVFWQSKELTNKKIILLSLTTSTIHNIKSIVLFKKSFLLGLSTSSCSSLCIGQPFICLNCSNANVFFFTIQALRMLLSIRNSKNLQWRHLNHTLNCLTALLSKLRPLQKDHRLSIKIDFKDGFILPLFSSCSKGTFFFSHWFSVKGGEVPPNSAKENSAKKQVF